MHCEECRNQLTDYVNDSIDSVSRARVQKHLASCRPCQEEARSIDWVWERLGRLPARTPDSAGMRARYDELIAAYRGGAEEALPDRWWTALDSWIGAWWPRRPLVQAGLGLALLLIGAAIGIRVDTTPEPPRDEIGELRVELRQTHQLVALSLMRQASASERLRGVSWSSRIDAAGNEVLSALLETLMRDPNVNVRLAAVDALRRFSESQSVREGALRALTREESPIVQSELIGFMVDSNQREATDVLRRIVADATTDESVRARAEWGLEQFE